MLIYIKRFERERERERKKTKISIGIDTANCTEICVDCEIFLSKYAMVFYNRIFS